MIESPKNQLNNTKPNNYHICYLYDNDDEKNDIIANYILEGLEQHEKIIYYFDCEKSKFLEQMNNHGINLTSENSILISTSEGYLQNGVFEPELMINRIKENAKKSLTEGFKGRRTSGEMSWTLKFLKDSHNLMKYESALNTVIDNYPRFGLCQYDTRKFSGQTIIDILRTHPYVMVRGKILQNPYYIEPDLFLQSNSTHIL